MLSEVVAYAKTHFIRLNIELKPTGHEIDFEKSVIDVLCQNDYADSCVITSQEYRVLENVKTYDPSIRTVYVMSLAYGSITTLTDADDFSVEASNVTESLVRQVHNNGGRLYAWTVNTQENIDRMIRLNVDNIITDDIELAKQRLSESRYSNLLTEFLNLFQ